MPQTPTNRPRPRQEPQQAARMHPKSAKDEAGAFERVVIQRLPAVTQASRRLQSMMGVAQGTKMMDEMEIVLWEMPEPPACSMWAVVEEWKKSVDARAEEKEVGSMVGELQGERDEVVAEHEKENGGEQALGVPRIIVQPADDDGQRFKRKREPSDPPKLRPQQRSLGVVSKTIIDLTGSPLPDRPWAKQARLQPDLLQSGLETKTDPQAGDEHVPPPNGNGQHKTAAWAPASPLPYHELRNWQADLGAKHPVYWCPNLSKHIRGWLSEPGIKSAHCSLASIDFRTTRPRPDDRMGASLLSIDARRYDKVKLIRMTLPISRTTLTQRLGPPKPTELDWLIVLVISKGASGDGFDSDSEQSEPETEDDMPYWIMAFPLCQVSALDITAGQGGSWRTRLVLGMERRVPLLHGYGIDARFAEEWLSACARGEGVVEMGSEGALPLQGW